MNNAVAVETLENACVVCDGTNESTSNPLLPLSSDAGDEVIHLDCALADSQYGFCWCCRQKQVFYKDDLNDANECDVHDGESEPDYPVEDAESYIENVRNNE